MRSLINMGPETIPSYIITPDPSELHVGAASLQFAPLISIGFRSEDWDDHGKSFILCISFHLWDPFCVDFDVCCGLSGLDFILFFCLWYLIESMMPSIWTRCPGHKNRPTTLKIQQYIKLWGYMAYFLSLFILNPSGEFAVQQLVFVSSEHKNQCHLKYQSCVTTRYARVCFWMSEDNFSWNINMWCMVCLIFFRLHDPKTQLISAILQLWSLESLWPLKLSSSLCIRTILTHILFQADL